MTHTSNRVKALLAAIAVSDDLASEAAALELAPAEEPALLALAVAPDVDQRWWAVRALAIVGTADSVATLQARLSDTDPGVRAAAALAIAYLHGRAPAAVAPILEQVAALLDDDEGTVRQAAADALALCGDNAVPVLAQVLWTQTHEGARTRAAGALRKIATIKAAAVLYPLLNDSNHLVRTYAYEGLDEMGLLENVLLIPDD